MTAVQTLVKAASAAQRELVAQVGLKKDSKNLKIPLKCQFFMRNKSTLVYLFRK